MRRRQQQHQQHRLRHPTAPNKAPTLLAMMFTYG
jgi:hypothetical protein